MLQLSDQSYLKTFWTTVLFDYYNYSFEPSKIAHTLLRNAQSLVVYAWYVAMSWIDRSGPSKKYLCHNTQKSVSRENCNNILPKDSKISNSMHSVKQDLFLQHRVKAKNNGAIEEKLSGSPVQIWDGRAEYPSSQRSANLKSYHVKLVKSHRNSRQSMSVIVINVWFVPLLRNA